MIEPSAPPSATIASRPLRAEERGLWDAYVAGNDAAGIFHRWEWGQVFGAYRLPVHRLAAFRDERIVGILPLVEQKSLLFGAKLISLPWFDAAGIVADDDIARQSLIDAAKRLAIDRHVADVELRQGQPLEGAPAIRDDKALLTLALTANPDDLWNGLDPKVRNQIRKGTKAGLEIARGRAELIDEFYAVYSHNMRDLGSPSHHRRFFVALAEQFPKDSRVYVVRHEGRAIGCGWTLANGRRLEIPWASSLRDFNSLCVNHFLYWNVLEDACRAGFERFHFGRSTRDTGPYKFKRQWGAEPSPLCWYQFSPHAAAESPRAGAHETYGWATRVWQKLPLAVARRLGPLLISKLP